MYKLSWSERMKGVEHHIWRHVFLFLVCCSIFSSVGICLYLCYPSNFKLFLLVSVFTFLLVHYLLGLNHEVLYLINVSQFLVQTQNNRILVLYFFIQTDSGLINGGVGWRRGYFYFVVVDKICSRILK